MTLVADISSGARRLAALTALGVGLGAANWAVALSQLPAARPVFGVHAQPVDCAGGVAAVAIHSSQCFGEGTPVETEHGLVPIENVAEGDRVWSRDPTTGDEGYHEVVQTFVRSAAVMELEIVGDSASDMLIVTGEHPFWRRDVEGGGWVRAQDLLPGDEVFTSRGGWARVGAGTWLARDQLVYNFEVEGSHTYFVGETGAWVHNTCVAANRIAGNNWRDNVANQLRRMGYGVDTERATTTLFGRRVHDIVVYRDPSLAGSPLAFVETKWGSSSYTTYQRVLDEYIYNRSGIPTLVWRGP